MDRMPAGNNLDGYANNSHLFGDSQQPQQHQHQQYNAYETPSFLSTSADSNHNFDASWAVNGNEFAGPHHSRGLQATPNYHVPTSFNNNNGQASPYARNANQSPPQFNQTSFANYSAQPQQTYQYRPPPQQQQQQYDPSLVTPSTGTTYNFFDAQHGNAGTIAPQALDRDTSTRQMYPYVGAGYQPSNLNQAHLNRNPPPNQSRQVNQNALIAAIPQGADAGMFGIIKFDDLARATNSERMGNFANVGKEPYEWNISRSAIPAYVARMSRNEMRRQTGHNPKVLAKIGKKSSRQKSSAALPKALKAFSTSTSSGPQIKYEQDSSSDEESSDDDSSAYSDDDDESDSPLPSTRPDDSKGAVEYDTIKALWRSKRRDLEGEVIRKSLVDFWEVIKTIRDRWKVDIAAVAEAEQKKRVGELPLLKSRVKDQRDMIEVAFRTALKHGHRDIVSLLSENTSLVFVCYQVLLDRFKADDVNAGISKTILETMSLFTTLNNTKLEKVNLEKLLPRVQKKGDARVQFWVKKILQNAEAIAKDVAAQGAHKSSATVTVKPESPPGKRAGPEPVAGVKRSAAASGDGGVVKKLATGLSKTNGATANAKVNGASVKLANDATKVVASATAPAAARKTVVAKPSGFFSGLQSAAKKPGTSNADRNAAASTAAKPALTTRLAGKPAATAAAPTRPAFSFAETMANLAKPKEEKIAPKPQKEEKYEKPEDRAKRLRKEQRRKLHVRFKEREELVEIRYFTHDPDEELGHDASQMRDMSDVGGEGRVLKQHKAMEDLDDEDEIMEDVETLLEFSPPSLVDFSVVDEDERKRNYAPFGGGEMQPDSAERGKREAYENSTLLVFYPNPSDIPSNPREPADPYTGDSMTVQRFGDIEQKYADRAIQKRLQRFPRNQYPGRINNTSFMMPQQPPAPSAAPATAAPDISAILASLKAAGTYNQPQQQPAPAYQFPVPAVPAPAPNIDLAAILANLAPQAQQQANYNANGPSANFGQQSSYGGGSGRGADKSKNPNYKTQPCKFWPIGKCVKGDKCSYLHEG
ncbi:unnamed protein product [Zymoseptoria tritici ST99CH_3D1]|nr:unnamed protein product [Zymoseptoria tritici ST99CH_3D1]